MEPKVWHSNIRRLLDLKSELDGHDISPRDLAKAIGVTHATVYTWLSDEGVPTISADKTARLANYFGVEAWRIWRMGE